MTEESPGSGDFRVDAALARLAELDERPPGEHVAIYEDIHRRLQEALTDVDGA